MIARCILYLDDSPTTAHATVVLTPSWMARLFGARAVSVDVYRKDGAWHTVATRRELGYVTHGSLIRDALDFREVGSPARWALASGAEAVTP